MNPEQLYSPTLKKNGKEIVKASVLYTTHKSEPLLCDFCDNRTQIVSIKTLGKDTLCICKECVQAIRNLFGDDQ